MDAPGRILFLTPQLPYPPEQGTAIRNYHLIARVAERYRVSLLSFVTDEPRPEHLDALRAICARVETVPAPTRSIAARLRTLVTSRLPDMAHRLWSPDLCAALRRLLAEENPDIVQVEGIELARYGLQVHGPAVVFDDHNAEFLLQRRACLTDLRRPRRWPQALYSAIQWRRLSAFERRACLGAGATLAVSAMDGQAIARLAEPVQPLVVPNGVDTLAYRTDLPDNLPLRHPNLVFTGKMDYRPNVDAMRWFHAEVWPRVRERVPDVHLYVVGKSPSPEIERYGEGAGITVTGYVPDILPYFGGADVYIVPLRVGGGTRLKVLEAMASGLAIVSTRLGAEGIDLEHGRQAMLADTPDQFADAIVWLLRNPEECRALGSQARQAAEAQYDWRQIVPRLFPLYDGLIGNRANGSPVPVPAAEPRSG